MSPLCLFYFAVVATCIGAAGHFLDQALPGRASRRWVWSGSIALSVVLPIITSAYHTSASVGIGGYQLVQLSAQPTASSQNWLDCSAGYAQALIQMWLYSVAALLAWGVANASWVARLSRKGRRDHAQTEMVDGVPVIVTESLGPATVGFFRSRVLVPEWVLALPGAQRRYVLHHENEHRRAYDAGLLCLAAIIVCLFPWNPALWWQLRRLRLAVEMDCDNRVVSALGDPTAYGELLLRVAESTGRGPRLQPAFLGGSGMLEYRLRAMLAPPPRDVMRRFVAPALAIVLLLVVLSVPHPGPLHHAAAHQIH